MIKTAGFWAGMVVTAMLSAPVMAQDAATGDAAEGAAAPAASEGAVSDATADTVVATVDGTTITLGHMIALRASLPQQYQALPDETLFKGILDQLVQQTTLEQSVKDITKRDTLTLENDRRGYLSGVALKGVVEDAVTDAALQAIYDEKYTKANPGKEYSAAHILVTDEEQAKALKAELDGGADFAALASANSIDTGSAANGGDLGWFGLGMMVQPFEDAVVGAEVNKVIGPVKSEFGYHLILVKETRAETAPTLDDVRDSLAAEIERVAVEDHIKALTDAATITRPGEALDPALLKDATLLDK